MPKVGSSDAGRSHSQAGGESPRQSLEGTLLAPCGLLPEMAPQAGTVQQHKGHASVLWLLSLIPNLRAPYSAPEGHFCQPGVLVLHCLTFLHVYLDNLLLSDDLGTVAAFAAVLGVDALALALALDAHGLDLL